MTPASPRADLFRALATLSERPVPGHRAISDALGLPGRPEPGDHAAVFLFGAYPYASVYLGAEGMLGGEARDRVAGFWRALGLAPPAEPDHLAALLGLYASLLDGRERAGDDGPAVALASGALLWEHLLPWSMPFLDKVEEIGGTYYGAWARILRDALTAEARSAPRTSGLPLHLRAAPGLPHGDGDGRTWLDAILAPVRSGLVLTRWDLRRGAAALGMHARVGERAYMLRSLVEQDPGGVTRWLAGEAQLAARRHRAQEPGLGAVAAFWRERAEVSAAVLAAAA